MGHSIKVTYIHIQNSDLNTIDAAREVFRKYFEIDVELKNHFSKDMDESPLLFRSALDDVKSSDFTIVRGVFLPKRFMKLDKFEKNILNKKNIFFHSPNPEVSDIFRHYFDGTDEEIEIFNRLLKDADELGEVEVLKHISNHLGILNEQIIMPEEQKSDGIYSPGVGCINDSEEYLKGLDPNVPVAGLLFRTHILRNYSLEHIDALIDGLRGVGFNVIPVFFPGKSRKGKETFNSENVIKRYFTDGEKSRIDVLIVMSPFSLIVNSVDAPGITSDSSQNFLKNLINVPVIQALTVGPDYCDYGDMRSGVKGRDVSNFVAWPEIDGQIISVPVAYSDNAPGSSNRMVPLLDRIEHLARMSFNWVKLARKPKSDRKIAILVYQKTSNKGRLGMASGMDTMESIVKILTRMKNDGYSVSDVPENGRALLNEMMSGLTNDVSNISDDQIRNVCVGTLPLKDYLSRYAELPQFNRDNIESWWGKAPGTVCVVDEEPFIPGILKGNVLIGIQPPRAWGDNAERLYHDPIMPPQHQYLAYYQWLRDVFHVDAIIHLGTHGSLEWLPGKNAALSRGCYPDMVLDGIPNIYPYIIDNPGEGIQAKRRSEAVLIGYSAPVMVKSELYGDLELLDFSIGDYLNLKSTMPEKYVGDMLETIREIYGRTTLNEQIGVESDSDDFVSMIPEIKDRLEEIKDTLIPDGLHVLGEPPHGDALINTVLSCLRTPGHGCGSLKEAVASAGFADVADRICYDLLRGLASSAFRKDAVHCVISENMGINDSTVEGILFFVCDCLVPRILQMTDEMDHLMDALNGQYVVPGPPGAISRGDYVALPTGRNIYGIDPDSIPTRHSWNVGMEMGKVMLERYVSENGCYPHSIAFIIWATDTMKTGGDDVAYILWLMGVRPVWSIDGHVTGLDVIPLEELGHPRIDVSVRITGLFRDSFPNLISLFNDAVVLISELDEGDEDNYLRANLRDEIVDKISNGIDEVEARETSFVRVFGSMYGSYGSGVNHAIENRNWKDAEDLSRMYTTWGGCGFGKDGKEIRMEETFVRKLSSVDIGIKNMPDRQMDVFTGDDVYGYLGGLLSLAKTNTGKNITLYVGDGSNPSKPIIRTAREECGHVMRSKILNDRFIDGLRRHGFQGVSEFAKISEYMIGWDATSGSIDDWMFYDFAERIVLNESNREWMEDENPYSLMEIIENLNEAISRGLWNADDNMKERLGKVFMEVEERLEEINDHI